MIVGSAPTAFTSTGQTWASTGLASSTKTLVLLGAATRILPAFDSYRLTLEKVQDQGNPTAGSASMLNRELRARYRERLQPSVTPSTALPAPYPLHAGITVPSTVANYSSVAGQMRLVSPITNASTSIQVDSITGLPATPFKLILTTVECPRRLSR